VIDRIDVKLWNEMVGNGNGLCCDGHEYYYWYGYSDLYKMPDGVSASFGYNCPECELLSCGKYSCGTKDIYRTMLRGDIIEKIGEQNYMNLILDANLPMHDIDTLINFLKKKHFELLGIPA